MYKRQRQFPDDHTLLEEYNRLHTEFEAGDGYLIDVKINTILNGMGFAGRDRETLISAPVSYTHLEAFTDGCSRRPPL